MLHAKAITYSGVHFKYSLKLLILFDCMVVFTLHGYLFVHFIRNYGSKNLVSRVLTRLPSTSLQSVQKLLV